MKANIRSRVLVLPAIALALVALAATALAENIDPNNDQSQYAWAESVGWINFEPASGGAGVDVGPAAVTGYAWGEAIGWVNMNCSNLGTCGTVAYGVTNNGAGVLGGYAWSESKGWIKFSCATPPNSCGAFSYGVAIDPSTGEWSGHAWGESIGWLSFNCDNRSSCATVPYDVQSTSATGDNDMAGGPFGGTQAWIADGVGPEGANSGLDVVDINDDNDLSCTDAEELGGNINLGGMRNPLNPWDFADVPAPALPMAGSVRNGAVSLSDVGAALTWVGATNNGGSNVNGRDYDNDDNGNGVEDGAEYDRTPAGAISGPPNGAVSLSDVGVVLNQVGDNCTAAPN
jgi:hypothetical protein